MSTSESRAVTMMIGTGLSARICWQISMPDWSGSMTSRRTRSGCTRWKRRNASWPSPADSTVKPSRVSPDARACLYDSSSSTTRTRGRLSREGPVSGGRPEVAGAFAIATL